MPYTIYRTIDNIYVGEAILDDSHRNPLSPDNWLIPAGCVTVPPPALAEGEQARWDQDTWVIEAIPKEEPITITPPPQLPWSRRQLGTTFSRPTGTSYDSWKPARPSLSQ